MNDLHTPLLRDLKDIEANFFFHHRIIKKRIHCKMRDFNLPKTLIWKGLELFFEMISSWTWKKNFNILYQYHLLTGWNCLLPLSFNATMRKINMLTSGVSKDNDHSNCIFLILWNSKQGIPHIPVRHERCRYCVCVYTSTTLKVALRYPHYNSQLRPHLKNMNKTRHNKDPLSTTLSIVCSNKWNR